MEGRDGHQVWTEQNIYREARTASVDLEFRRHRVRQFCELKCYSTVNNDTPTKFIKSVFRDYAKFQSPLTPGNASTPAAIGSTLWVVGIAQSLFRDAILSEAARYPDYWQHFNVVSVNTMGVASGTTTFDIYYAAYTNIA